MAFPLTQSSVFGLDRGGACPVMISFGSRLRRVRRPARSPLGTPALPYDRGMPDRTGTLLAAEIARRGRLPWPQVARIGAQAAAALADVHADGLVHGSLTTDSILLDGPRADQVLVTGFGAAGTRPGATDTR